VHRRLTFQGDSQSVTALAGELTPLDGVIALAHVRSGSLKPPGDLLQVEVLNRTADEVIRRARARMDDRDRKVTLVIAQTNVIIDRDRRELIETDADEALWEEMESDLRNHGRVSANYLVLMALGGAIGAAGLLLDGVSEAIAFVGASIIAPGFEPVAKLTQALVLRQWRVCLHALWSILAGYALLLAAAFLVTLTLSLAGGRGVAERITGQPVLGPLAHFDAAAVLASAAAAIAGILIVVSLRDLYVVGPLMVLVLIPGVALVGAALAIGEKSLALGALRRVGADLGLIIVLGAGVFYWKQRAFHRRRPL
jgi:hypothetical protein